MITLIFLPPIALSLIIFIFRLPVLNRIILQVYGIFFALVTFYLLAAPSFSFLPEEITRYFSFDPLAKFFMLILAVVNLGVTFYSVAYFKRKKLGRLWDMLYAVFHILFITSMAGVIASSHLALSWVCIEATTLFGAMLIYLEKERTTLEAVWKYIFICSIGVSLSFIGIILLSMGTQGEKSLFFADLVSNAGEINPLLLKLAFAFLLVGAGTKMGLSPVHAWLPDAHSEAPAPVSALLSGVLLNAALVIIIRFTMIMNAAGFLAFSSFLLTAMGLLSLLVSASYIIASKNYKRMLAFSSIENMGIIAICIGLNGPAIFVALLQAFVHSLGKAGLFLTSGNVYRVTGSKRISDVRGLFQRDKLTAVIFLAGFIVLSGLPPFAGFLPKILLATAMIGSNSFWLFVPVFLLLLAVFAGLSRSFISMAFTPAETPVQKAKPASVLFYAPQIFFLVILLVLGFMIPQPLQNLLDNARDFIVSGGMAK